MTRGISLDAWMDTAEHQAKYLRYLLSQYKAAQGQRREVLWVVINVCNDRNNETLRIISNEIQRRTTIIREA